MAQFGALKVIGSKLCGQDGKPVMLRGMSTHGVQWFPQYVNKACFKTLKDDWKTNVVRLAMYIEEQGYLTDGKMSGKSYAKVIEGIDACLELGLYVIVDWHVSNADQTPRKHWGDARDFFASIVKKYGNRPEILYEICNEPNNAGNDYASQIADFADDMIRTIRAGAPDAVVIIGSGEWSKHPLQAWEYDKQSRQGQWARTNVMYTLHRYNDGDFSKGWWNNKEGGWSPEIIEAVTKGCPIFATECGVSNAQVTDWGTANQFVEIIEFYERLGIPWCVWSLADKVEPCSVLKPGASSNGNWPASQITEAGKLVISAFQNFASLDNVKPDAPVPEPQPTPAPAPVPSPVEPSADPRHVILTKGWTYDLRIQVDGKTVEGKLLIN